jgi:hypothetical protein
MALVYQIHHPELVVEMLNFEIPGGLTAICRIPVLVGQCAAAHVRDFMILSEPCVFRPNSEMTFQQADSGPFTHSTKFCRFSPGGIVLFAASGG